MDDPGAVRAGDHVTGTRARRIAVGRHHDRHGRAVAPAQRRVRAERAGGGGVQQPGQRRLQQGEYDLRLRVAEARVELDHPRAGRGDRQAHVEQAGERGAPAAQLRQRRVHHVAHHVVDQIRRGPRQRRVRAHAARVRPGVAVADPLEVLRRQQRHRRLAVGDHEQGDLGTGQVLLDHHPAALRGVPLGDGPVVGDHHTLAGGESVVLHHVRRAELVQRAPHRRRVLAGVRASGRHRRGGHHVLRERLRALQPGRLRARAEHRDALGAYRVGDARHQRRLRPDDHQVRSDLDGEGRHCCRVGGCHLPKFGHRSDPRIPRSRDERLDSRVTGESERESVLPPTTTHKKYAHDRHPTDRPTPPRRSRSLRLRLSGAGPQTP